MRLAAILLPLTLVTAMLRAGQPAASKPGNIEGTVVNSATSEPIRKASVSLEGQPGAGAKVQPTLTTMSDASGRFHFDAVEPGLYSVSARRDAYMEPQGDYGMPAPFRVVEEQHVSGIVVKLIPLGVLSGRVQDEDGDPIPRANVAVLRNFYQSGRTRLGATALVQTNDLGEFEILNLPPTRYYLQVAGPQHRNIPVHTQWAQPEEAYPISFYPNARQLSEATPIDLSPGAHVDHLDFHLRKVPAHHIRGRVAGQTGGQPETLDQITLDTPGMNFGAIRHTGLLPDGSFDISGVASGLYEISYTRLGKGESTSYPAQSIHVDEGDLNGLVFAHMTEVEVSGTIAVEGSGRGKLNIYVALEDAKGFHGAGGMAAEDGSFHIRSAPMAVCRLDLRSPPEGYYVKSIRFGDREIKDGVIDLTNGADGQLNILLASDGGIVEGNVLKADGQPAAGTEVTVARSDEYGGRSDLLKRATTDAAGNFHIKDVAPGDYRVYAWEMDFDQSTQSAEFRKLFDGKSAAVSVGPNGKALVRVSVITADEIARERSKLP